MTRTRLQLQQVPVQSFGIDVGLRAYLTDSKGVTVENPRHYRKAEKKLKRLQRRLSRKQKELANR